MSDLRRNDRRRPAQAKHPGRCPALIAGVALVAVWIVVGAAPVPTSAQDVGVVLFRDDFATYSGRWTTLDTPKASAAVDDGLLRIRVVSPGVWSWSQPDFLVPQDGYRIEAYLKFADGGADGQAGIALVSEDTSAAWAWLVARDGTWHVWERVSGVWTGVTEGYLLRPFPVDDVALLSAEIVDGRAEIALDGQVVRRFEAPMAGGSRRFGVVARAGRGYVDAEFDDVLVTGLSEERPS